MAQPLGKGPAEARRVDKEIWDARLVRAAVLLAALVVSCAGFMRPDLPVADDIVFHLYRIEGLSKGLAAGELPVRMQTSQVWGMGYPVSVFYGDLLLYPVALLHLTGLSIAACYKCYVVFISLLTMMAMYALVRRMLKSDLAGMLASVVWTLAPYRLLNMYVRAAVGEYTALAMLPLLAYGLYLVFWGDDDAMGWAWFAVGLALVVCSHTLSALMVLAVLVPILVLLLLARHDAHVLRCAALTTVATLALAAWFILPFVSAYLSEDLLVEHASATTRAFAYDNAAFFDQFLRPFAPLTGSSMPLSAGTEGDLPYEVGAAQLVCIPLALVTLVGFARVRGKRSSETSYAPNRVDSAGALSAAGPSKGMGLAGDASASRQAAEPHDAAPHDAAPHDAALRGIPVAYAIFVLLFMAALTAWLASSSFPWNTDLGLLNPLVELLATVQFPWRFVGLCAFSCSLLMALCITQIERWHSGAARVVVVLVVGLALVEGCYAIATHLATSKVQVVPTDEMGDYDRRTYGTQGGEFLTYGTTVAKLIAAGAPFEPEPSEGLAVEGYDQRGSQHSISLRAEQDASVKLPLLWYQSLVAEVDDAEVEDLTLVRSEDGRAELRVPGGFSGTVTIHMKAPLMWHVAEGLSLATLLALLVVGFSRRPRKRIRQDEVVG